MKLAIRTFSSLILGVFLLSQNFSFAQEVEHPKKIQNLPRLLKEETIELKNKSLKEAQEDFPVAAPVIGTGTVLAAGGSFYLAKKHINNKINLLQLIKKLKVQKSNPSKLRSHKKHQKEKIK